MRIGLDRHAMLRDSPAPLPRTSFGGSRAWPEPACSFGASGAPTALAPTVLSDVSQYPCRRAQLASGLRENLTTEADMVATVQTFDERNTHTLKVIKRNMSSTVGALGDQWPVGE